MDLSFGQWEIVRTELMRRHASPREENTTVTRIDLKNTENEAQAIAVCEKSVTQGSLPRRSRVFATDSRKQDSDVWQPRILRVVSKTVEAQSHVTLRLQGDRAERLPEARPGQFNMLYVPGVGEIPVSFSGIEERTWEHTIRAVGSTSAALCALNEGTTLGVRGPYGCAWPLDLCHGRELIVVAGGLGLAPLKPVVDLAALGQLSCVKGTLLCGFRDPTAVIFEKSFATWQSKLQVWRTVDTVCTEATTDSQAARTQGRKVSSTKWTESIGFVHTLLRKIKMNNKNVVALVCGPEIMMRAVCKALIESGVPAKDVFVSLERSMKCAVGHCGHCQLAETFLCKDGPVYPAETALAWMTVREL